MTRTATSPGDMTDSTTTKGFITKQYTVWCGICSHWEQQTSAKKLLFMKRMRKAGWKLTTEKGWTCPRCVLGCIVAGSEGAQ